MQRPGGSTVARGEELLGQRKAQGSPAGDGYFAGRKKKKEKTRDGLMKIVTRERGYGEKKADKKKNLGESGAMAISVCEPIQPQ